MPGEKLEDRFISSRGGGMVGMNRFLSALSWCRIRIYVPIAITIAIAIAIAKFCFLEVTTMRISFSSPIPFLIMKRQFLKLYS